MEYAKSLNLIGAALGCEATVVTRYNSPAVQKPEFEGESSAMLNVRDVKFVAADFGMRRGTQAEEISFHLRGTQVRYADGAPMKAAYAIARMKECEPDTVESDNVTELLGTIEMDAKYTGALESILQMLKEATGAKPILFGTKTNEFLPYPAVGLFCDDGDQLIIIQFKE